MTKKFREIILHAGLPKTGSTSIQNNCYQHREVLLQNGICYPAFNLAERRLVNHSDPLTAIVFADPNKRQWAYRQRVMDSQDTVRASLVRQFDQIVRESQAERLLLSAEIVANYSDQDLKELRKYLGQYTDKLRVLVFLRSPQSSVESILQQQAYGGGIEDNIKGAVVAVRERFEVLHRQFKAELEVLDFHQALELPGGLVGTFMRALPLEASLVSGLEFSFSNERVSIEAYRLMVAINNKYPVVPQGDGRYQRKFHDLQSLSKLPGAPFGVEQFKDTDWYAAACREETELQEKYGFRFPEVQERAFSPLWQANTLVALEDAICRLESVELREAAADCLENEAREMGESEAATILRFISERVRAVQNTPYQHLLEEIGADYFKFAALQLGSQSPRLALQLMSLAQNLRPHAEFINERVQHYRNKLKKG